MASKKHEKTIHDPSKTYEGNEIQLKGIVYFGVGLTALIVVTFALMWALLNVLEDYNEEEKGAGNPMAMTDKERLPPEPRLQLAPGFGFEGEHGRVNLELLAPQAEYRELHRQWMELWKYGQKDRRTGATSVMPIDEAKERLIGQNLKAKAGAEADAAIQNSQRYLSDASSGRMASEIRR